MDNAPKLNFCLNAAGLPGSAYYSRDANPLAVFLPEICRKFTT